MPATERVRVRARPLAQLIAGSKDWSEWVLLFVAALALASGLLASHLTDPLDALIHDAVVRATPHTPDPRILIVAIDETSVRTLGRWPWRREVHAAVVEGLTQAKVAAIGYDVLFVEPADGDDNLASASVRAARVALPLLIEAPGDNGAPYRVTRPVVPSATTGHVIVRADPDGVVRRITPLERAGTEEWRTLALATLDVAGVDVQLPKGSDNSLIPYAGPPGTYPTVSLSAVLAGEVPDELLRNRIVFVGASASGLGDRFATPVGGKYDLMAGVETQANIADALIRGDLRQIAGPLASLGFAAVALALLWGGFLFAGPRENLALAALLVVAVIGAAALLLVYGHIWIRPAALVIVMIVMFPLWGWRRLAAASRFLDTEIDRLGGAGPAFPPGGDRIARQIAVLGAASENLATLRRQRDETLAFLSHDLRSPAAAILGIVPDMDRVAGHARRLLRLADQFVQGLRAEEAPLLLEPVELAAVLDEAADQCWEAAQRVGGTVSVTASWDIAEVSTDRALMARAIVNLIDNALKYGGERPHVQVRGWFEAGYAMVTVADGGPGMAAENVATLFNRFERAGAERPDGVGLGLALVATFARRQEGRVICTSRPGVGTVFELSLPVS